MVNHRDLWTLRPPGKLDEEIADIYDAIDKDNEFFTIRVHYGGTFRLTPLRVYDGSMRCLDVVSIDFFNKDDMDYIAVSCGYKVSQHVLYLYRIPGSDLDNGLRPLISDAHIVEFLRHASEWKFIDMFFDDEPLLNIVKICWTTPSTVVLREIDDEVSDGDGVADDEFIYGDGCTDDGVADDEVITSDGVVGDEEGLAGEPGLVEKGHDDEPSLVGQSNKDEAAYNDQPINDIWEDLIEEGTNLEEALLDELHKKVADKKGKGVKQTHCRKRVRFTQGTSVKQCNGDIEVEDQAETQGQLPELDENGNFIYTQIDEDVVFGMNQDGFDYNELEAEIVTEREIRNPFESCNIPDEVEVEVEGGPIDDDDIETEVENVTEPARRQQKPQASGSKKKRQPGTYARYEKEARERASQGFIDSEGDSDSVDSILDDNEVNSDMESLPSDSDEESTSVKNVWFNEKDMRNPKLKIGLIFSSKKQATNAMVWYAVKNRKAIRCYVNDSIRLKYKCTNPCKWSIWISKSRHLGPNDFKIKTMSVNHKNCPQSRTKLANSTFFAVAMEDLFRMWPDVKMPTLQVAIDKKYGIKVSGNTARRIKEKALRKIEGDHVRQFNQVWDYSHELRISHPGSTVLIEYEETSGMFEANRFQRIYICLKSLVDGFMMGCRKLIGLDGCHTKGMYKQQILTAVAVDPNNGWWPIAWAVVEQENKDTWSWFIGFLMQDLKIVPNMNMTFISDKQKGLESALYELLPFCRHRTCVQHLYKNFKLANKGGDLRDKLWECARASNEQWFDSALEKLKDIDQDAYDWLAIHAPEKSRWCKAFFPLTIKSDMLCNNMSESFNAFILQARDKPIITMLEMIRKKCMERIRDRRVAMERKTGPICPRIMKIIDERMIFSEGSTCTWNGGDCYEVVYRGHQFAVNIARKECTCRLWQLSGIPCVHSIPCILDSNKLPQDLVDDCYSRARFIQTYQNVLYPTNGQPFWVKTNGMQLQPPLCVKLAGRPKKARRRAMDEIKQRAGKYVVPKYGSQRCGICGKESHNRRSCPQNPNDGGGRPEKGQSSGGGNKSGKSRGRGRRSGQGRGEGSTSATPTTETQSQPTPRRYSGPQAKRDQALKRLDELLKNFNDDGITNPPRK